MSADVVDIAETQRLPLQEAERVSSSGKRFLRSLGGLLRVWRGGLWWCAIFKILTVFLLGIALYGVGDFFLAPGQDVRQWIGIGLLALVVGAVIWVTADVWRHDLRAMARRADRLAGEKRQPVLTALELQLEENQGEGLQSFLKGRAIGEGNGALARVSRAKAFPGRKFRKRGLLLSLLVAVLGIVSVVFWPIASVVLSRVFQPWLDVPPYSPFVFTVSPESPEVYYGEDTTVTAVIEGGKIHEPIRFLTRSDSGQVFETLCFQDGRGQYAQRLEKLVEPVEFSFSHGKARSAWHRVELLMEPKVALASCRLRPPSYAGLSDREFLIGEEALSGLKGSQLELSITSNRPLLDGELLVKTATEEKSVVGEKTAAQTLTFAWTLQEEAELALVIRDLRGTANREPFRISQRLVVDKPPQIRLTEPPLQLMATPTTLVPLKARAEDDLGIGRIELVRAVVGFRDRSKNVSPLSRERRYDFKDEINLGQIGVSPGETLEFYFEASDRNPSLTGVAASEVARVQVISEENYANMIRTRTTVKEFAERFRVVNGALQELRKALDELNRVQEAGDAQAREAAWKRAQEAAKQAGKLLEILSQDFAAFELEKSAVENATGALRDIRGIERQLSPEGVPEGQTPSFSKEEMTRMLEQLGVHEQNYQKQKEQAEEIEAIARLMEQAAVFSRLVQDQDSLVRRLSKYEIETRSADIPFLKALGKDQEEIESRLEEFVSDMSQSLRDLPPVYEDLAKSAGEFLDAVKKTNASRDMKTSTASSEQENGQRSWQYSSLALEKLNQLLEEQANGQFGGMCQGGLNFEPKTPGLRETLEQMLSAIGMRGQAGFGQQGRGGAGGGGAGMGGDSSDGYSMGGYTALDIPVMGPPRMRLHHSSSGGDPSGGGDSQGAQEKSATAEIDEVDQMDGVETKVNDAEAMDLERVPEKYREAVKRYFAPDSKNIEK